MKRHVLMGAAQRWGPGPFHVRNAHLFSLFTESWTPHWTMETRSEAFFVLAGYGTPWCHIGKTRHFRTLCTSGASCDLHICRHRAEQASATPVSTVIARYPHTFSDSLRMAEIRYS